MQKVGSSNTEMMNGAMNFEADQPYTVASVAVKFTGDPHN